MKAEEFDMPGGGKITRILSPDLAKEIERKRKEPLDHLINALCNFDIWYMMSDDYGVWLNGRAQSDRLNALFGGLTLSDEDRQMIFDQCLKFRKWTDHELSWLRSRVFNTGK